MALRVGQANENLCRICMGIKPIQVSLFRRNLSMKIMKLADVKILECDGLPSTMCLDCEIALQKCYEFIAQVEWADKKLRENLALSSAEITIEEHNIKLEQSVVVEPLMNEGIMSDSDQDNNETCDKSDEEKPEASETKSFAEPFSILDITEKRDPEDDEPATDPINHVELVENRERTDAVEMAEDPLGQEEPLIEAHEKYDSETAVDPLKCMKEEAVPMDTSIPPEASTTSSSACMKEEALAMDISTTTGTPTISSSVKGKESATPFISWPEIVNNFKKKLEVTKLQQMLPNKFVVGQSFPPNRVLSVNLASNSMLNRGVPNCSIANLSNITQLKNGNTSDQLISLKSSQGIERTITLTEGQISPVNNEYLVTNEHPLQTNVHVTSQKKMEMVKYKKQLDSMLSDIKVKHGISNLSNNSILDKGVKKNENDNELTKHIPSNVNLTINPNTSLCLVCNVDFVHLDLLNEHKKRKGLVCRVCIAEFESHSELENHFVTHTPYKCKVCKIMFFSKRDVLQHRSTTPTCNIIRAECEICNKTFLNKYSLKLHKIKLHSAGDLADSYKCVVCSKSFKLSSTLRDHMRFVHIVHEYVECVHCKKLCLGPERLKVHVKAVHIDSFHNDGFGCPTCGKRYKTKLMLHTHKYTHDQTVNVCEHCGKSVLKGRRGMNNHVRHEHKNVGTYTCEPCNKHFNTEVKFVRHLQKSSKHVSSFIPFYCEICGKAYKTASILKNHLRIHSDEKPFKCEVCNSTFKQQVCLKTHMRVHSSVGKYYCENCAKSFKWKQTFDKHVKKCNTNEKEGSAEDSSTTEEA